MSSPKINYAPRVNFLALLFWGVIGFWWGVFVTAAFVWLIL